MTDVTYEVVVPDEENIREPESLPAIDITPGPPSAETIRKMELSLEQMKMLRKALKNAQRFADPHGTKAKRKKQNRRHAAIAKTSRKRNR